MRKFIIIILLFPSLTFGYSKIGTVYTTDGSQLDVQAAVDNSSDGDTITFPSGTHTYDWGSSAVSWSNKNITIQGQGVDATTLTGSSYIFDVTNSTASQFRITGLTITSSSNSDPPIQISSRYQATAQWVYGWRIDNIKFNREAGLSTTIRIYGVNWGLIDNCSFYSTVDTGNEFWFISFYSSYYDAANETNYAGEYSWGLDIDWGTYKALYIEDNIFSSPDATGGAHPFDCGEGARLVFRYNDTIGGGPIFHPNKTAGLGPVKYEIYNNTFAAGSYAGYYPFTVQGGGTGVVFKNQWSGFDVAGLNLMERRISTDESEAPLGKCSTSNALDGYVGETRTNPDSNGWPCKNQVGRGPGNISMPVYAWYNGTQADCATTQATCTDTVNLVATGTGITDYIKATGHSNAEVDFVNNGTTAKPGYTPYTYPHPLRGITNASHHGISGAGMSWN